MTVPAWRIAWFHPVLGEFPEQGEDALISLKWAEDAQERECLDESTAAVEIGVDVARFGSDESVCLVRCGHRVVTTECWRGYDTVASAGRVTGMAKKYGAVVVKVDDPGRGMTVPAWRIAWFHPGLGAWRLSVYAYREKVAARRVARLLVCSLGVSRAELIPTRTEVTDHGVDRRAP